MATAAEIATLRLLIAEPDNTTYTDAALSGLIDASGSLDAAALQVWTEKAATYVGLVDVSEGGSSRKLGDLHKQALLMIANFQGKVDAASFVAAPRITRLGRF